MKTITVSLAVLALVCVSAVAQAHHAGASARRIAVTVTPNGFEPSSIPVRVGQSVVLVVTRTTEQTCAKEFVIASRRIRRALPLNQPVEIAYTAKKAGAVRFACGMDMVSGQLVAD
jgi:plastocyanin domain-containing protein